MKEQVNTLNFIKIKNVCPLNDTVGKMRRQVTDEEKILADHMFDKDLRSL